MRLNINKQPFPAEDKPELAIRSSSGCGTAAGHHRSAQRAILWQCTHTLPRCVWENQSSKGGQLKILYQPSCMLQITVTYIHNQRAVWFPQRWLPNPCCLKTTKETTKECMCPPIVCYRLAVQGYSTQDVWANTVQPCGTTHLWLERKHETQTKQQ